MAGADPGARIGELLDRRGREAGPQARETANELVRSVVEFYVEGLARTVRLLRTAQAGSDPLAVLTADELVGDLLILPRCARSPARGDGVLGVQVVRVQR
ncbi:hypothetical protein LUR56_37415 [Streptomyces sp. MT29]|nr:hypothetical protein [Streptomyces sp. MT29]